MQCLKHYRFTR